MIHEAPVSLRVKLLESPDLDNNCHLAEAPEHDPVSRDPSLEFLRDEEVHEAGGALDAGLVLAPVRVEAQEIKPGRHLEARVERHWHLVGCGTDHFHVRGPGEMDKYNKARGAISNV